MVLWFAAILIAFFVLVTFIYLMVDLALVQAMTDEERVAYLRVDDLISELDPVSESTTFLLVILVTVPLSILAGAIVALKITRPITNVGEVAQKVVNGELSARADLAKNQRGSEIGDLVENVNSLLDMVQASDERIKTDAAAIAHELRTPLAALQMKLHGMIDGVVDVSAEELKRLLAQSQVLSRVVDDLRTLSLASHGELMLVRSKTDLLALARSALEVHSRSLDQANMKATVSGDAAVGMIDPDRMRQALSNLIENSIRYAAEGGVIDIHVAGHGETADIKISDRGPGLGLSFRSVVFEPFQREEDSRSREFGGSGLGLSIVKAIAQAHGGTVQATGRNGGGLDIVITLPLRPND
ncbi:ATP-binding protein [Yoonia sp. GPGPB17]|uniref:ATP-binding protein n=1 Tax=Yoonia sp. GPGPB17 TaxID=3026147 RepID=UPI0030BDF18A